MVRPCFVAALIGILAFVIYLTLWAADAPQPASLEVGLFSAATPGGSLPDGWKPLTFKNIDRHTAYSLVKDGDRAVIKAVAVASASGLVREVKIDLKQYPVVKWQWKVTNTLKKGDVHRKEGDDYPARLYITFEYDPGKLGFFEKVKFEAVRLLYGQYPPVAAINYIWESKAPMGTVVPNSYTDRVKMIVVETGQTKLHQWVTEERNLHEDFKHAFGSEPPMISGVAIMTDTDNTGESATTYYGDILFERKMKAGE